MGSSPENAWIAALETSGRVGSVAIARGPDVLAVSEFGANLRHAVELLPTLQRLCVTAGLPPSQLDEVYVSVGPGSFTGLRIGITAARTLAWSAGAAIVAVSTVDVIAQNALDHDPAPQALGVVLDAKRQRIFAAAMVKRGEFYERTGDPREWSPAAFVASLPPGSGLMGEGVAYHRDSLRSPDVEVLPEALNRARAEVVHRLGYRRALVGQYDDVRMLVPVYIRPPEAEEVWQRKHGGAESCFRP